MDKGCILSFHKKEDLEIAQNYRCIFLTSISAKIYNALLLNRIESKKSIYDIATFWQSVEF